MLTREEFPKQLREALNRLQDPDHLRHSPLAALFGVANRFDTFSAMQDILSEAIESLEPSPNEPPHSRAWRIYESLYYRYVQQLSQPEVANQLGIGARQLRREQRAALEALADVLWEEYDLRAKMSQAQARKATVEQAAVGTEAMNAELAWLKDASLIESADPNQALSDLVDLAQPLADQHCVHLEIKGDDLPSLAVHPVALIQTLLNLVGVAIHVAPGGTVSISARCLPWEVEFEMRVSGSGAGQKPISEDDAASLEVAGHLADLCRGRLHISGGEQGFGAALALPALEQLPVLAIDDNPDALELLQRYTAGTRYRLVGTRDPEQAVDLAQEISPQVILLDVMMPQVDGWKVLRRLRQHPSTSHIPILICTILGQEELALSLSASGSVRKPFTRQAILAALDQQIEMRAKESR